MTENNSTLKSLYKDKTTKTITEDDTEMANVLNKQFESVFSIDDSSVPSVEPDFTNKLGHLKVNSKGIIKLLKKQKSNKAMGADQISFKILKGCSTEIAEHLADLFNHSLKTSKLPEDWKHAEVVPLFKKQDPLIASNYRPISLTSLICKMMEHIIVSHINKHLEKHEMLNKNQHGFR